MREFKFFILILTLLAGLSACGEPDRFTFGDGSDTSDPSGDESPTDAGGDDSFDDIPDEPPVAELIGDWHITGYAESMDPGGDCEALGVEIGAGAAGGYTFISISEDSCILDNLVDYQNALGDVSAPCAAGGDEVELIFEVDTDLSSYDHLDDYSDDDDEDPYDGETDCFIYWHYDYSLQWVDEEDRDTSISEDHLLEGTFSGTSTLSGDCPAEVITGTCNYSGLAFGYAQ